ncbi:MAG TPA: hypothetical protein VK158_00600 [Acidobacteriota bacterium]|nr:hypothetical protein [Acidobacteriota bacterium]
MKKKGEKSSSSTKKKAVPIHKRAAPPENAFKTIEGKEILTILELAHELDLMAEHVFSHHVTADRNDFATWVADIFQDSELADALGKEKSKDKAQIIIYRHIIKQL